MNAEDLANELNLDIDDQTIDLIRTLIRTAETIVQNAVNSKIDVEILNSDLVFQRAVATLATQMFYDRTLDGGMSLGLRMMIENLQGKYINGDLNELPK